MVLNFNPQTFPPLRNAMAVGAERWVFFEGGEQREALRLQSG